MGQFPADCWFGVTVERGEYLWRLSALNEHAPAGAVRFVSIEPILENVVLHGMWPDWVIAGPETDTGAREFRHWWLEHLAHGCDRMGVPFFDKRKENFIRREWPAGNKQQTEGEM